MTGEGPEGHRPPDPDSERFVLERTNSGKEVVHVLGAGVGLQPGETVEPTGDILHRAHHRIASWHLRAPLATSRLQVRR